MKLTILATLFPAVLLAAVVPVVGADLTPQEVQDAMRKGVAYLKNSWRDHGKWSDYPGQEGGVTCLCTLALLNAGEKPGDDDEHVYLRQALEKVRQMRPATTYVVALQTMVLCRTDNPDRYQDIIARNVEWLQDSQIVSPQSPDRKGSWSYGESGLIGQRAAPGDGSNSQFALLALYEAACAAEKKGLHIPISRETWRLAHIYWTSNQYKEKEDGGWGYLWRMAPTGSMTCAGVASLVICSDVLHEPDAKVVGDAIDGCYRASSEDRENIAKGIEWLRRHFSVQGNPAAMMGESRLWHYYYLYGLERAGRLSARRKIGEHDWYREGAKYLVRAIGAKTIEPLWQGNDVAERDPDVATSLALLFLSKGRWPALMAKVQYGNSENWRLRDADRQWNWHRNDVNNLTIHVENKWDMDLTWQEIDINKATVDDLLQVPVLFFSGNGNPLPETKEAQQRLADNLRDYVDRGGFIFADCEPCSNDFDAGFRKLMDLVFRKPEYRFKPLDKSHPIWLADEKPDSDQVRLLLGIDYGCRTSVVYAPVDPEHPRPSLACLWELSRGGAKEKYSKAVQEQIKGGLVIARNVLAYATNRELKSREMIPEKVVQNVAADPIERGKLAIVKLEHGGGCDAAPRALANLMEQAAHELNIRVETHPKLIAITDPALFNYPIVFVHGRNAFRFTDAERKAIRAYVERGALLFGDAICGSEAFAESFRGEMGIIFPKSPLLNIPASDPIWTKKYGGYDLHEVTRRDPQPAAPGQPMKSALRKVAPEMKGVKFGERYGVIFSEFDLSCALEMHNAMECRGYTREDAARIGLNVIRYGMQ
jgi:hypothetical protein